MDLAWKNAHENPPHGWENTWRSRQKVNRFDTERQANKWLEKNPTKGALIDIHPKDGHVVYINRWEIDVPEITALEEEHGYGRRFCPVCEKRSARPVRVVEVIEYDREVPEHVDELPNGVQSVQYSCYDLSCSASFSIPTSDVLRSQREP